MTTPEPITYPAFVEALAAYGGSNHTNPTTPRLSGSGVRCVNFSVTPSPTGTQRCLVSTVLNDLGHNIDRFDGGALSSFRRLREDAEENGTGPVFASIDDEDKTLGLAEYTQADADNAGEPLPWSEALRRVATSDVDLYHSMYSKGFV